jgi:hypothetical protein
MKGRGLISVALVMGAMIAGAFAAQYYTWTTPLRVKAVTVPVAVAENEAGAVLNGRESWTGLSIVLPSNTGENYKVRLKPVAGTDLINVVDDLECSINSSAYQAVVLNGVAQTTSEVTLNGPDGLGFAPGTSVSVTIDIKENTKALTTDTIGNLDIQTYLIAP